MMAPFIVSRLRTSGLRTAGNLKTLTMRKAQLTERCSPWRGSRRGKKNLIKGGQYVHLGAMENQDPTATLSDAIYLCKRTMQNKARLELADYEAENLARLQRAFARKWEFIFMQAEAQVKIDRKKDKTERKILDSQERAFWDVHRPVPGCVNTTEMDIRKCRRLKNPQKVKKSVYGVTEESQAQSPVHVLSQPIRKTTKEDIRKQITFLNAQIDRHCLKMSKVAESLIAYTEQYVEYDPLITPAEPSNPWISDDVALWDIEMSKEPSQQRVKRWGFSFDEILKDQVGRDQFLRFLESEFSSENLRFWLAVQDLKKQPLQDVAKRVEEIWQEFLAPGAPSAINLDSHSYEITSQNVKDGGRYTFEDAQEHIYKLMKSDSYARFLRSNAYQDLLLAKKKPESEQGRRTSLEKFTRSVNVQNTRPAGAWSIFMAALPMAVWLRTPRSCHGLSESRLLGLPSLHDGLREGKVAGGQAPHGPDAVLLTVPTAGPGPGPADPTGRRRRSTSADRVSLRGDLVTVKEKDCIPTLHSLRGPDPSSFRGEHVVGFLSRLSLEIILLSSLPRCLETVTPSGKFKRHEWTESTSSICITSLAPPIVTATTSPPPPVIPHVSVATRVSLPAPGTAFT
ncbi:regulator of G-protein signaling 6 isoform X3 [Homo sapiens]|uniref:regulator of G-protein signaling 6 isoform X3 n=1 Tax=Homo sapiens TaxID=9606 RepID=UPI0005D02D27|nr:regulator of G-protein signaling 6 isoform X3 [Homo sapiens]|eukprot:XP_011535695.1 regulator of G-protein signaling 6 isoform X4 [Homo sapiens]